MDTNSRLKPLRTIIIDDEPHVLEGIKNMITWPEFDLCQPLLFSDSDSAFDYMMSHEVDIVITDVNMPGRNGLEILEAVTVNNINTEVVIISGYRDFSYVQRAMEYGAVNYLTKPIFEEDLINVLSTARKNIAEKVEKELYKKLYLDEGLQLYLHTNDTHDFSEIIAKYKELFEHKSYMMISLMSCNKPIDNQTVVEALREEGLEYLEPYILDSDHKSVFIVEMKNTQAYYEAYIESHFGGYYDVFTCDHTLVEIKAHYQHICNQMNRCHHYKPSKRLLHQIEVNNENNSDGYANQLIEALNKTDDKSLEEIIKEMFITYNRLNYKPSRIYRLVIDIYSQVLSNITTVIGDVKDINLYYDVTLRVEELSVEKILMFTNERFFKVLSLVKSAQIKQKESFKYETENYIREHIHHSITLKEMADHVHMHPTYLGKKLNELWGESFTRHVHRLKIEKSLALFEEGNYKHIEEIARDLGYKTYQSYLKYFKLFSHTTPKLYVKSLVK